MNVASTRWQHTCRAGRAWRSGDCGSGTMAGAALVALAGAVFMVSAVAGNLFICTARARVTADLAAISGAHALLRGTGTPCPVAEAAAAANSGSLVSCTVDSEDVIVRIRMPTNVPFAPELYRAARAGPVDCEQGD